MKFNFIILLLIIVSSSILAQPGKFAIEVIDNSSDRVGEVLTYQIKEKIRESNSLRLTYEEEVRMQIDIKTMSYEDSRALTIYAIVWILKPEGDSPIYYTSSLGYAGKDRINKVALSKVARTVKLIENLKKYVKWENPAMIIWQAM